MRLEHLLILVTNGFVALLHAGLFVVGFLIIKQAKSWLPVFGVCAALIFISVAMTAATFALQGWERASAMLLPSGEYFHVAFMPTIINAVISTTMIMCAAYGLFVAPGNQKHV